MNQYLLLRDNKQSGPYSTEELIAKGLKKYDLVWLEGRSAAWRYPCEFDELKPYAPEVEEQPYDRFYKKPGNQTASAQTASTVKTVSEPKEQPVQKTPTPVEEKPVAQPVAAKSTETNSNAKHIYVTMPVDKGETGITTVNGQKEEKPQSVQQQSSTPAAEIKKNTPAVNQAARSSYLVSEEDDEQNSALLKDYKKKKEEGGESNTGFLSDYEARKAAYQSKKSDGPVSVQPKAITQEKKSEPVTEKKVGLVASSRSRKKDLQSLFVMPRISGSFFQDNKTLTRSLLAACLILGGVVIGLIINAGKHKSDAQVLETLVKEIREQQKDKSDSAPSASVQNDRTGDQPDNEANNDNLNYYNEQPPVSNGNNIASEAARHALIKKENTANGQKPVSVPVSNTSTDEMEAQPAVMENKEKNINQETIEKARRNIYDLVGVEASQYKVGLLGGISELDITISNNSLYALDQIAVEIKYYGPEKKLVKTQTLVFNHVPPGKQRTLEAPSTRRGITIDYSITGINSKALGLAQAGN